MSTLTIILLGISAIFLGLWWWRKIQASREGDSDFKRRDEAKEEAIDKES